jgi:NADH pyrophosphatase NudC (nudix superfamily)
MLGDYYKKNPKVAAIVDQAVEVVKWFNNHSFCLGKLREEQMVMYRQAS